MGWVSTANRSGGCTSHFAGPTWNIEHPIPESLPRQKKHSSQTHHVIINTTISELSSQLVNVDSAAVVVIHQSKQALQVVLRQLWHLQTRNPRILLVRYRRHTKHVTVTKGMRGGELIIKTAISELSTQLVKLMSTVPLLLPSIKANKRLK